jgi:hypothetical protein
MRNAPLIRAISKMAADGWDKGEPTAREAIIIREVLRKRIPEEAAKDPSFEAYWGRKNLPSEGLGATLATAVPVVWSMRNWLAADETPMPNHVVDTHRWHLQDRELWLFPGSVYLPTESINLYTILVMRCDKGAYMVGQGSTDTKPAYTIGTLFQGVEYSAHPGPLQLVIRSMEYRSQVVEAERVSGGASKRRASKKCSHLRVIYLRRLKGEDAQVGDSAPGSGTPLHFRVPVIGHWRNQACGPKRSKRRPIWIQPHERGPDDAPLKVRQTVVKVKH